MLKIVFAVFLFLIGLSIVTAAAQGAVLKAGSTESSMSYSTISNATSPGAALKAGFAEIAKSSSTIYNVRSPLPAGSGSPQLQTSLQQSQQVMQILSNISKTLHDTAVATIRRLGG
jgi:hypothetical protein